MKVKTTDLQLSHVIAEDIFVNHTLLVSRGTKVSSDILSKLYIFRQDVNVYKEDENEIEIGTETEKLSDESALVLSDKIKERARTGVEYMFKCENADEIVSTANSVSSLLMEEIVGKSVINVSLTALHLSDEYTFQHSVDVGTMALLIARKLGYAGVELERVGLAGILHDIGKTKIPNSILNKPAKLTDEEFTIMKAHPVYGYQMLVESKDIEEYVRQGVLQHHEKYDGSGYPLKYAGNKINMIARILAVADVYDALVTERPYKKGKSPEIALEMMFGMHNHFDIRIVQAFLNTIILHPVGEHVFLSNGEECVVEAQNQGYPLRPVLKSVSSKQVYDLVDPSCLSLIIVTPEQ
ncbi:MAG: HD-GYP domain-containing protein [Lachnospiraceae bacterium]|nr:HD-GYP domain-containing protein [Lachnospiraceae bacterium]